MESQGNNQAPAQSAAATAAAASIPTRSEANPALIRASENMIQYGNIGSVVANGVNQAINTEGRFGEVLHSSRSSEVAISNITRGKNLRNS
jgi:hypothetical protein